MPRRVPCVLYRVRGNVVFLHRSARTLKEQSAPALFVGWLCQSKLNMHGLAVHIEFFSVCQKLFSVTNGSILQFCMSMLFCRTRRRSGMQRHKQCCCPTLRDNHPFFLLCLVSYCSRAAHTAAGLMGTRCTCSTHHAHRMRLSRLLETHLHSDGYG